MGNGLQSAFSIPVELSTIALRPALEGADTILQHGSLHGWGIAAFHGFPE
jgi:hypothetical protein